MNLAFPHKGFHKGLGAEKQPAGTTPWINNMRVIDTQDNRFRGGQRPGLQRAYTTDLIGGLASPIVILTYITIVD